MMKGLLDMLELGKKFAATLRNKCIICNRKITGAETEADENSITFECECGLRIMLENTRRK